jgi:cytoskeletal protein RodZ
LLEREQLDQEREERERRARHRQARPHRGLKGAVWIAAVALLLAVGALVATELHTWHVFNTGAASSASGSQHHSSDKAPSATLQPVSTGDYSAAYNVTAQSFSVTVSTDRPTWVEAAASATGPPTFAAELPAGATKQLQADGPIWLDIGAGGSTVVVRAEGKVIGTLRPALAPWQVSFTPTQPGG